MQGDAGQSLMEQFGALGRAFEPEHAAGAGSTGRHREMFDHKQRSPCHQQDKLFDTEEYERSKPAAFLGTTKKRVDEADARMIGAAPELWLAPDPAPNPAARKIFDSKRWPDHGTVPARDGRVAPHKVPAVPGTRHSATRPADQMAGSCSEPTAAESEDPFMVARPAAFASNMSGDGMPHRFAASVATGTSIPGSRPRRPSRCVYTPASHGNILAHDSGPVMVEESLYSAPRLSTPLSAALERPPASPRFSYTPQDCDIFAVTGLRSAATPLPLLAVADLPLLQSKRREGPFTPRDNLRSNGLFS